MSVPIVIKLSLVDEGALQKLDQAVEKLNTLKKAMEAPPRGRIIQIGDTIVGREVVDEAIEKEKTLKAQIRERTDEQKGAVEVADAEARAVDRLSYSTRILVDRLIMATQATKEAREIRSELRYEIGQNLPLLLRLAQLEKYSAAMAAQLGLRFEEVVDSGKELAEEAKEIKLSQEEMLSRALLGFLGKSSRGLYRVALATETASEITKQMTNYVYMEADVQQQLAKILASSHPILIQYRQDLIDQGVSQAEATRAAQEYANVLLTDLSVSSRVVTTRLREMAEVQRRFYALLGPTGQAVRVFTREIFWTGLGMMFTSMSLARLQARQIQAQRGAYLLARAHMRIREAQEDLQETIFEYGRGSKEAIDATIRLREAEMALQERLQSVRNSLLQQQYAWAMLVFGMMPSMLRTGQAITDFMVKMNLAQKLTVASTQEAVSAQLLKVAANFAEASSIDRQTEAQARAMGVQASKIAIDREETAAITTKTHARIMSDIADKMNLATTMMEIPLLKTITGWIYQKALAHYTAAGAANAHAAASLLAATATQFLIGVLTFGIGILASFAMTQLMVSQQMTAMKRQAKELEEELTGHSLVDSLEVTRDSASSLADELKEMPSAKEIDIVQRIKQVGEPFTGEQLRDLRHTVRISPPPVEIAPHLERAVSASPSFNIVINGPWYIREEGDIETTAKTIRREMMRSIRSRTGGRL